MGSISRLSVPSLQSDCLRSPPLGCRDSVVSEHWVRDSQRPPHSLPASQPSHYVSVWTLKLPCSVSKETLLMFCRAQWNTKANSESTDVLRCWRFPPEAQSADNSLLRSLRAGPVSPCVCVCLCSHVCVSVCAHTRLSVLSRPFSRGCCLGSQAFCLKTSCWLFLVRTASNKFCFSDGLKMSWFPFPFGKILSLGKTFSLVAVFFQFFKVITPLSSSHPQLHRSCCQWHKKPPPKPMAENNEQCDSARACEWAGPARGCAPATLLLGVWV